MDIKYRNAQKEDCSKIAQYINYASDGLLDFLFEDNAGGMTTTQILNYGLENEDGYDSYKSVIVAEYNLDVIGIVQAYSSMHHKIDEEMRIFFSKEKLEQFKEFYESRVDNSFLINAMFVNEDFRRKGIGAKFISLTKIKAKSLGFDKLSLFVLADNISAQKVYQVNGFKKVKEIQLEGNININYKGQIYLMSCDI